MVKYMIKFLKNGLCHHSLKEGHIYDIYPLVLGKGLISMPNPLYVFLVQVLRRLHRDGDKGLSRESKSNAKRSDGNLYWNNY